MDPRYKFVLNPETGEIFNATEDLIKHMVKLRLTPCPLELLRTKRPDLFPAEPVCQPIYPTAAEVALAADMNVRILPEDAVVMPAVAVPTEDEEEYLPAQEEEAADPDLGAVMDPNRLTLLVEAISTLDPATGFTKDGLPIPGKLAKAIGSRVTTGERDMAWIEYQHQSK